MAPFSRQLTVWIGLGLSVFVLTCPAHAQTPSPPAPEYERVPRQAPTTRLIARDMDANQAETRLKTVLRDRLQKTRSNNPQRLYNLSKQGRVIATLIFDERRAGVLVEAQPAVVDQIELLLNILDKAASSQQRHAIISIENTNRSKLERAIDAYRRGLEDGKTSPDTNESSAASYSTGGLALTNFVLLDDETATNERQKADDEESNVADPVTNGGLDVDVDVQTLPDLDVIILRGRNQDVQKLREIIEDLERLSRETQPRVHVIQLQHANSDAVTEILEDVSDDLTGRRQGRVSVTSLTKPNAILLIGWGDAVEAMTELIGQLDTPVAANSTFRVYHLKFAPANSVTTTINQFFANRTNLGTRVQAVTDVRSNSVVVQGSPRDLNEVDRLVHSLDTDKSHVINRAKVIDIHHALAADIAETLRTAIRAADGQGAPSAVLELLTVDGEGERILQSGILSDVRITENTRNNSIVLSGPIDSLPLLEQLIRQLDVPGAVSQIKVFRVVNGDASSLTRTLRSLLPTTTGSQTGPQLSTVEGETSLAPLRFSVDTRTNSIIATGSEGDLRIIEALLLRLDEKNLAERKTEVYRLRNAPSLDVATAVNEFLRSERVVLGASPGQDSPFDQIEREVVVVPEPVGNSLIISATSRYFDEVSSLVRKLDQSPPQVMIQVLIAEVRLDHAHEFGVELGLQDSVLFDRSLLGDLMTTIATSQQSTPSGIITATEQIIQAATNQPGFNFNNSPLGNSGSKLSLDGKNQLGGQSLSHFDVGRTNEALGFGGLVLSASSNSISVLIRALHEAQRLDVLARPQVRTLDNQPAFVQVGQRVPRITASNITEGGLQTNTVELENVGLIMGVTPRISPDNTVVMEIDAEKSRLGSEQDGIPITVSLDGTIIRSPRIDTTTAQTTVSAASGETIIIGGLITNSKEEIHRAIPYLSDIPVLGDIFKFDSTKQLRTELLIILTPHVIRTPEDAERIKRAEMARMSWCAADIYEIHGDIDAPFTLSPVADEPDAEVIYPHTDPRGEGVDKNVDLPQPELLYDE